MSSLCCALHSRIIAAFVQLPIAQVLFFFKVVCLEVQARCNMHESGQLRSVVGDNEALGLTCWKTKKKPGSTCLKHFFLCRRGWLKHSIQSFYSSLNSPRELSVTLKLLGSKKRVNWTAWDSLWHVCQVKNDASVSGQNVILSASHAQSVLARLCASHAAEHVRQTECTDDVSVCIWCVFPLLTLAVPVLLKLRRWQFRSVHLSAEHFPEAFVCKKV